VITHPSVAGAAVLAGLIVAGGTYAARHDVGLGSGLQASTAARVRLEQELPLGRRRHPAKHLLAWHPPHVPKIHVQHRPPAPVTIAAPAPAPAPTYVAAAPVATTAPVTRTSPSAPVTKTSPVGGDDGGGGDD
jgi:hypothetical protein